MTTCKALRVASFSTTGSRLAHGADFANAASVIAAAAL